MRVTGGELRGRRLKVPARGVRPTADRVRESLFMVLTALLPEARVLDLFAGSGALGIEALSRGAAHCLFVEIDPTAARILAANLAALGLSARSEIGVGPAQAWLQRLARAGRHFDLVLVDPPYAEAAWPYLRDLRRLGILAPGGLIAWEHDVRTAAPADMGFVAVDERRYGDTVVTLLSLPAS